MALAYVIRDVLNMGSVTGRLVKATPAAADYPAGGYDLNADRSKLGFAVILFVIPAGLSAQSRPVVFDRVNKKLKWFRNLHTENTAPAYTQNALTAATVEETALADLSADNVELLILGA